MEFLTQQGGKDKAAAADKDLPARVDNDDRGLLAKLPGGLGEKLDKLPGGLGKKVDDLL